MTPEHLKLEIENGRLHRDIANCLAELKDKNRVLWSCNIRYDEVCAQLEQVQDALRLILPMAEAWCDREFDFICDHEPDDCSCDAEALARANLARARAALDLARE